MIPRRCTYAVPVWFLAVVSPLSCELYQPKPAPASAEVTLAANERPESRASRDSARMARARTGHVIIVSIDGLRPDAISRFGPATLQRLSREGRYALHARTIVPSTTIPSHVSMLTGVGPLQHRVLWNDDNESHAAVSVPTVFSVVKREGLSTAAFYSKSKFAELIPRGALDTQAAPTRSEGIWPGESTVARAVEHLRGSAPSLLFVHIGEPDYAGHSSGWMTDAYAEAVRGADSALGHLLVHADSTFGRGAYTVIVTSDHGGHSQTHGSTRANDLLIPWVVWGAGVEAGLPLTESIRTMDTAATALWLLGIDVPRGWSGRAVSAAFVRR